MDAAISEQEKNVIDWRAFSCHYMVVELLKEGTEQGRSSKPNLIESLSVRGYNIHHSSWNIRILWISIDSETMTDTINAHMPRDSTKSEEREALVMVVGFYDLADLVYRCFILVILSEVVQGTRIRWVSIRCGVINGSYD